ncbi:hypothetical protein C8J57DRAFT_1369038 [Mycena rebaudengoi]|nr:hypothetical protein C8J57DRAFT_1369038 [Mycena rebaudengoi]
MHGFSDLSPTQCTSYAENGFLVLSAPSEQLTHNLVVWTNEIKNLPHKSNAWLHYEEMDSTGNRTLTTTENIADYHDGLCELFCGPEMLSLLRTLAGEEMVLFKEKINYKTDAPAYVTVEDIKRVITVMISVDPQTTENGCLEVSVFLDTRNDAHNHSERLAVGSHKMDIPVGNDHCLDQSWCNNQQWIPLHLQPGQFVIFDSHLAHRSGANNTDSGRAAIFATYNSGGNKRAAYYADRRKLWPATGDREPGEEYATGAHIFGFATPMLSVDSEAYKSMGL